jgi:hypothetical protein
MKWLVLYSLISTLITKGFYSISPTMNSLQSDYRIISTTISSDHKMITASYPLISTLITKLFPYHIICYLQNNNYMIKVQLWLQNDDRTMSSTINSDWKKNKSIPYLLLHIIIVKWLPYHILVSGVMVDYHTQKTTISPSTLSRMIFVFWVW